MGIFDFFRDAVDWVKEKVEDAVYWVNDKLASKTYDEDSVEDHVDVDAVLAEFRESIQPAIEEAEKDNMDAVSELFSELIEKTEDKFPDLIEIIKKEQKNAKKALKKTTMKYVKEHLSENDEDFLIVLKMRPGKAKNRELDSATERVFEEASRRFYSKLKRYAEHILEEFTTRLDIRIADQEERMNQRISELEELQKQAENGQVDVEVVKEKCAPIMETSKCIIRILGTEM